MKFTNGLVVLCVLCIALLNGCTSLLPFDEAEKNVETTSSESLTPLQIQGNALKALPNLYKTQTSGHNPSAKALSQFQDALLLKQQGKFPQAKSTFLALSERHPNLSGIWVQLALLAKAQGKDNIEQMHKDMSKYLKSAIAVNALNYIAHNELALLLRQQGQFQLALTHYELALKSWPAFAQAYLNRGILYDLYLGEKPLALADYELYQVLSNDDSRQLKGWIIDLQRQVKSAQQAGAVL